LRFIRHFLEMFAAMALGMLALEPLWPTIDRVELQTLAMATNMTMGMAALMAARRHAWPRIVEMSAAMYAPFIILFMPYWTGLITAGGLFLIGHLLMLPAMLVAMLHRRAEYTAAHTTHHSGRRPATSLPRQMVRGAAAYGPCDPAISPAQRHMASPNTHVKHPPIPRSP
jgi:flagellar biosynthetic protein FliP